MTDSDLPYTVYTPESKIRHPWRLIKEMFQSLKASRNLAWRLMVRDISAMYRQTALGYFWAVFPPMVTSLVLILMRSSAVISVTDLGVPYPVYVMMGTIYFQLFVDALNAPLKMATESKAILTKIHLPGEALILSGMGQVLFSFFVKMALLVVVFIIFRVPVPWTVCLLPLPLTGLLFMGTMIGVLLIPAGLLYKDIQSALLIVTSALVFLTPVAYPPIVGGTMGKLMALNPISPFLMAAKELTIRGIPADITLFFIMFAATLVLLFLGWMIFRLALPIIIERIGA